MFNSTLRVRTVIVSVVDDAGAVGVRLVALLLRRLLKETLV